MSAKGLWRSLTCGGMVEVDGIDLHDIVAVESCWVDVFVEFFGV